MIKKIVPAIVALMVAVAARGQIDSSLLRHTVMDTTKTLLNMDAVYNRPFLSVAKIPVALGGYVEANWQHLGTNGVTEGHQFQMRRMTLFVASSIYRNIKFLSELEFEDGTKEISLEFAALDMTLHPLFNIRGGVVMNPIGAFNQNHDGPKWEFIDRPVSATQMLPATWSNVGFGVYGKKYQGNWLVAYEVYLTNGFDDKIIDNRDGRTALPAAKENPERFEESFNGVPLLTAKAGLRNNKIAEIGISYMGGVYNKFEDDGVVLDKRRRVDVVAVDMNTTLPVTKTYINAEWAWVHVDIPATYTQQYAGRQYGGFIDLVQPVYRKSLLGFDRSVINVACRLEYVDWNAEKFAATGGSIGDYYMAIVPALSWRPVPQTVIRLNYRYSATADLLNNPLIKTAGFQAGFSSYF